MASLKIAFLKLLLQAWMPISRRLPPSLAYRIYYGCVEKIYYRYIEGAAGDFGLTFNRVRAMIGNAKISSRIPHDIVELHFAFHGCSEWTGLTVARCLVPKGGRIFEIGANLGTDTVNLAAIVGERGVIVAVEPNLTVSEICRERVSDNFLSHVTVIRAAVSEVSGAATLNDEQPTNSGMGYLTPALSTSDANLIVTTVRLDDLTNSHGPPDFIWMDPPVSE